MKRFIIFTIYFSFFIFHFSFAQNPKPFAIPEIQEWKGAQGAFIPTDMDDARIVFKTVKSKKLPVEGYIIDVTKKGVTVSAADERGFRWARQTMAQIMEQTENHALPCGTIRDYPLYGLRGFMLDCGRKFIPTHVIRDVKDRFFGKSVTKLFSFLVRDEKLSADEVREILKLIEK